MDVDDRTRAIMERAKQRKAELESEEGKENTGTPPVKKDIESPIYRASPIKIRETNIDEDITKRDQRKEHRRSVFADLAEEYEEFSHLSPQKTKVLTKEDFIKGKSPRLSIGETRPSVLCTPAGFAAVSRSPNKVPSQAKTSDSPSKSLVTKQESEETRQIRFAHPISTTSTYYEETSTCISPAFNESTIVAGYLPDTTFQSNNTSMVKSQETTVNESQDCGAHLFIRKKTPSSSSLKVCSPQPFVRGGSSSSFSRVLFNPSITSSPKSDEVSVNSTLDPAIHQTTSSPKAVKSFPNEAKTMSPVRLAVKKSAAAKNIANMLEERIKGTPITKLPIPETNLYPTIATKEPPPSPAVLTQWRGATNIAVVTGAVPGEPTKPDVRATNINKLKNRWEFSSITGTPLHPDESEDALVAAAIRLKDTSTPKTHKTKDPIRKEPADRSATSSPVTKSPRCDLKTSHKSPFKSPAKSPLRYDEPEEVVTEDLLDSEESSIAESEPNYSRAIDDAFEFMKNSPNITTPSRPAPLATPEAATPAIMRQITPPKPERQFLDERFEEVEEPKEPNSGLQYTVSFYRKRTRQEQAPDPNSQKIDLTNYTAEPTQQVIGGTSFLQSIPSLEDQKRRLQGTIYAQKTKIHQASKALQLCRNKEEFRGSHEEATAQWAVLVETEIGRAAENELQRLNSQGPVVSDGPLGCMTLSYIALELNRDFVDTYSHLRSSSIFYFCLILRSGDKVLHSTIVSSEEAVKKGVIEAVNPMTLKDLPTNFMASLDVYSFRTVRGQYTHEEKFGLKGSTMKSKGTPRQMPASHAPSDSSFQLVGRLSLDIHVPNGKKRLLLSDARHPIEGHVTIKIKKLAMSKTTTKHSGFLSMFQRTKEGLGSWNRYWCVLEEGGMKFWRSPEDEINDKSWLVLLDLQTCAGDRNGAVEARDPCQYMHSFNIDVWIPRDGQDAESLNRTGRPDMEKLRVMLAADTKEDMKTWLENINTTVKQLLTWNQPFAFAK